MEGLIPPSCGSLVTGVGQSIAAVCCTSSCAGVVGRGERGGLGSAGVAARHEKWGRVAQWGPATLPVATQQACSHSLPLLARNHAKCDWRSTSDHVKVTCERAVKKCTKALKVRHQVFGSSIHILLGISLINPSSPPSLHTP